jgi:hypothetical protein
VTLGVDLVSAVVRIFMENAVLLPIL